MIGFSALAGLLVTVMVTPALAVTSMATSSTVGVFESLPDYVRIKEQPQRNEIYAMSGKTKSGKPRYKLIANVYDQNRQEVAWDEVSDYLKWATVAGEDRRFYEHGGVDLTGVFRAVLENASSGKIEGGASTLSMQLIKNIFIQDALQLPTEAERIAGIKAAQKPELDRKLKEVKLAIGIEKQFTKDEILLKYLNIAGFGGNTYGIETAAQRYYNVSAKDVTIAQAASLVAIVQEPSARSLETPDNYERNKARRDKIIRDMWEIKKITAAERDEALATPVDKKTVKLQQPRNGCVAADKYSKHFCDYVLKSVPDLEGLGATRAERVENWRIGGYKLYTTLDLRLQKTSQDTVRAWANPGETALKLGGAAVSVEVGTGRILAMAQNKKFDDTKAGEKDRKASAINFNTDYRYGGSSGFQVGSSYKVFTLINWLKQGFGLNEIINVNRRPVNLTTFADSCSPNSPSIWNPKNDSNESGSTTVADATARSINGGFVTMGQAVDQCETKKIAIALGMHNANKTYDDLPDDAGLSSLPSEIIGSGRNVIAPMTVAAAYAGIANDGVFCRPMAVDRIVTVAGEELPGQKRTCNKAIDKEVAYATQSALAGAMNRYNANPRDGIPIIGKTGTTDKSNQTYVTGATKKVSTTIWVGNIRGEFPIRLYGYKGVPGGELRHTIGHIIMSKANDLYGGGAFTKPSGNSITGKPVQVPNLVGQSPEAAKAALAAVGLSYAEGEPVDSETIGAGLVAETSPGPGANATRGGVVTVNLSTGKAPEKEEDETAEVPNVVGMSPGEAKTALNDAGFSEVNEECTEEGAKDNKVAASDPAAGADHKKTDPVSITVSKNNC